MKFSKIDRADARRILGAMVTRTTVLARIAGIWKPELFGDDEPSKRVAGWAVEHFNNYNEAPGQTLQQKFDAWAEHADQAEVKITERLLSAASDEADDLPDSDEYLIDLAGAFFHRIALERAVEHASIELEDGRVEAAERLLEKPRRPQLGSTAIFKPNDPKQLSVWKAALEEIDAPPLIKWPRGLSEFFADSFARDSLVAFMGASGRAKSFWLLDIAYRALRQKHRVAYFECGDLSEAQVLRRMASRATGRPLRDQSVWYPTEWADRENPPAREERKLLGVTPEGALEAWNRASWKQDAFRLVCSPNSSITAWDIAAYVEEWALEGWVPDVIAIDYADILALPPGYTQNPRDGINANWQKLRRISQERHACVVTVTQADAGSYDAQVLRRRNFTDDRRKLDHMTSYFGINQTDEEKEHGIQRLNCMKQRNMEYGEGRCCWVAGCLSIARPAILAKF